MSTTSTIDTVPANASLHATILEVGAPVEFPRGALIFSEGEPAHHLYVVRSGKVKIGSQRDGKKVLLRIVGPDEIFGELALLDPGPRSAAATTLTETLATVVDRATLKLIIRSSPELAEELLRIQARRVRRANDAVHDAAYTDVPARLATVLLQFMLRFGTRESRGYRVVCDLNQIELAQLVGSTRESVNRALADFARRGWLQIDRKSVFITDADRLARRSRYTPGIDDLRPNRPSSPTSR
ncbi:Crp/Fnr family transcriptional regulator [Amycolatopsis sp. lyj-112]|uniref:Crp/Fnr family transcriptional regulator n=1 Tax=Amycolatopsis sp. lyj-112 TaxID=2789288 RepID=UPI00397CA92E